MFSASEAVSEAAAAVIDRFVEAVGSGSADTKGLASGTSVAFWAPEMQKITWETSLFDMTSRPQVEHTLHTGHENILNLVALKFVTIYFSWPENHKYNFFGWYPKSAFKSNF